MSTYNPSDFDTAGHAEVGLMQGFPPPPDKQVTAANGLWDHPYNRWAYQNMRTLLPTAPILVAEQPRQLARNLNSDIDTLATTREDGSNSDIGTYLVETFADSFVVLHGDTVVFERYLNGMGPTSPHQMFSCTKSFVGLFALMAIGEGKLDEAIPVGQLVPELDSGAFADASLRQVMDMTSSLLFNEDYADPAAHIHDYARLIGLGGGTDRALGAANVPDYLATLQTDDGLEHGAAFSYQTPSTDVVNWATNRATGVGFMADLDCLWHTLGCTDEAYMLLDGAGTPVAGGGLNASPNDLARFAAMILADGRVGDIQVVPTAALDTISAGGSVDLFMAGQDAVGVMADGHWSYRAQWWVRNTPGREAIMCIGVNGQWIYCDRARQVAIIRQASQPVAVDPYFDDYTLHTFDAIIDLLSS